MNQPDQPEKRRSSVGKALATAGILLSILYLLNLTLGMDALPDNLPIVGNIDEATATGILLACLRYLGFDVLGFIPDRGRSEGPTHGEPE